MGMDVSSENKQHLEELDGLSHSMVAVIENLSEGQTVLFFRAECS